VLIELSTSGKRAVREHEAFHFMLVKEALSQLSFDEIERLVESLENVHEILVTRVAKNKKLKTEGALG
jgi:DNA-binding MarR family transcriptional regulator